MYIYWPYEATAKPCMIDCYDLQRKFTLSIGCVPLFSQYSCNKESCYLKRKKKYQKPCQGAVLCRKPHRQQIIQPILFVLQPHIYCLLSNEMRAQPAIFSPLHFCNTWHFEALIKTYPLLAIQIHKFIIQKTKYYKNSNSCKVQFTCKPRNPFQMPFEMNLLEWSLRYARLAFFAHTCHIQQHLLLLPKLNPLLHSSLINAHFCL